MQVKSDCTPGNASIRRWSNWEKKKKSAAVQVTKDRKIIRENSGASRLWKPLRGGRSCAGRVAVTTWSWLSTRYPAPRCCSAQQASEPGCHSSHRGCAVWGDDYKGMRQRSGKEVELIETGCHVQKGIRKRESWRSSI